MEEITPSATSDATLLAPEEIKRKIKGNLLGKNERTSTDKKRERRQKKLKQRATEKRKLEQSSQGDPNKRSTDKTLAKMVKDGNVSRLTENSDGKYVKSSNTFFSKLQDDVTSHIKSRTSSKEVGRKSKKLQAKAIKL